MDAPDILKKIARYKADEVTALKSRISLSELCQQAETRAKSALPAHRFTQKITDHSAGAALICEVKKASPSKGVIREDFDPVSIAQNYQDGGACCLSVLTDGPGFQGSNEIFTQVRAASNLPLLRKDFMIDPIQIAESAAMGADCILIILAMIEDETARDLMQLAQELGMDQLVETHDEDELERAQKLGASLIGINNRDLRTFDTTLTTFERLAPLAPKDAVLVAESGIFTRDDITRLKESGAQAYLIGESLMRQTDIKAATEDLCG